MPRRIEELHERGSLVGALLTQRVAASGQQVGCRVSMQMVTWTQRITRTSGTRTLDSP